MGYRRLAAVAAAVWIAGLALVSFLPAHNKHELHTKGRLHYVGHLLLFMVAAALVSAGARTVRTRAVLLCGVAAFGFGVEYMQHITSHITVEWNDVLVDVLGVALGGLLLGLVGGMREPDELVVTGDV